MHGVEFQDVPDINTDVPIVADMSSNILSKEIDVSKVSTNKLKTKKVQINTQRQILTWILY